MSVGILSSPSQKETQSENTSQPWRLKHRKPGEGSRRRVCHIVLYCRRMRRSKEMDGETSSRPPQGRNETHSEAIRPTRNIWLSDAAKRCGGRSCKSASHVHTSGRELRDALDTMASEATAWRCILVVVLFTATTFRVWQARDEGRYIYVEPYADLNWYWGMSP